MTRRLPTAWPMPLLSVLLPAAAIVAVVGFGLGGLFSMPVTWPRVSAAVHDQLLLAGPIAAMAAFFYCSSLAGRRTALLALPSATRSGYPSVLRSFALLLAWMLAAYLVPFVPLFVSTAATATYGHLDVLAALAGPVGLALAVALGCVLGTLFPYPVLSPGVGVLTFLLFQLPNISLPAAAAFVPTLGYPVHLGTYENPAFVIYRLATMLVLIVLTLGAAGMIARGARGAEFVSWRSGLATLIAAALMVVPMVNPPQVVLAETSPPRACEQVRSVEVCLHQGHRQMLDTVVPVMGALLDAYGSTPPPHLRAVYGAALLYDRPRVETIALFQPYTTASIEDAAAADISQHLAGRAACGAALRSGRIGAQEYSSRASGRTLTLALWLRQTAGVPHERLSPLANDFLGGANTDQVQAWIAEHEQALAHCEHIREAR